MKCPSCGYEKRTFSETVDKVERYKSGKRKGEVKNITTETLTFFENDPDFIKIRVSTNPYNSDGLDSEFSTKNTEEYCWSNPYERVQLFACPECKTVIMEN